MSKESFQCFQKTQAVEKVVEEKDLGNAAEDNSLKVRDDKAMERSIEDKTTKKATTNKVVDMVGDDNAAGRERIVSTKDDVIGNPKDGSFHTSVGTFSTNNCTENFTNHMVATIQARDAQKVSRQAIADDLAKDPNLASGDGVTEQQRRIEIKTKVELWCSQWAPRHFHNEKVTFV